MPLFLKSLLLTVYLYHSHLISSQSHETGAYDYNAVSVFGVQFLTQVELASKSDKAIIALISVVISNTVICSQ